MTTLTLLSVEGVPLRSVSVLEGPPSPMELANATTILVEGRDEPTVDFVRLETPTVSLVVPDRSRALDWHWPRALPPPVGSLAATPASMSSIGELLA